MFNAITISSIPAFGLVAKIFTSFFELWIIHAIACSLAPEPIINKFINTKIKVYSQLLLKYAL